ncbi:MAG TPA: DoxX family protein [bacterium]|nr:DoxX family protein [bacterium]
MTQGEQCKSAGHKCCALSIVRFVLGIIFFMHGGQKVLGWFGGPGLEAIVGMMTGKGMPAIVAYLVSFGELLGGLGLIVGCLSRIAAAGIFIIMAGAVGIVHWKSGFFADKGGFEYPLALAAMALSIVIGGGGCLSIDNFFCKKKDG